MKKKYSSLSVNFQPMNLDTVVTAGCGEALAVRLDGNNAPVNSYPSYNNYDCSYNTVDGSFTNTDACYYVVEADTVSFKEMIASGTLFTS